MRAQLAWTAFAVTMTQVTTNITNATAILCMLRLGHSKLNIDDRYNQICQCGAIKTEVHMFLECPSTCASRRILFINVSKILTEENVFSYSEFAALNPPELVEIALNETSSLRTP